MLLASGLILPTNVAAEGPVELRVGMLTEPDSLNPFSAVLPVSRMILGMMYESLFIAGPEFEQYPQLCASWDVDGTGTIWTYTVVDDSFWHDGTPLTAHDIEFTFDMILDHPFDCVLLTDGLSNVTDVTALSDYTLEVILDEPSVVFPGAYVPVLPEHLWDAVVVAEKIDVVDPFNTLFFPDGPVGSGPMILDDYDEVQGHIRLLKQDPYHRLFGIESDSIAVDAVLFMALSSEDAIETSLSGGMIDIALDVPAESWDDILATPLVDGQAPAALSMTYLGFNCASQELRESTDQYGAPVFPRASENLETANLSVRQAIAMVVNQTELASETLGGMVQEADSLIPSAMSFWHLEVPSEDEWGFDVDAANDLLDQWYGRDDDTDGIRENDTSGAELEFEFYYILGNAMDEVAAGAIVSWCEQIGVRLNPHVVYEGTLYNMWFNLEYDLFIWNWQPEVDPSFILSVLTTDEIPSSQHDYTAWSDCFYSNPEYDQLYEEQKRAVDLYERQALVHDMQDIVYRDCPYVMLWYPYELVAYRTDVLTGVPDMGLYPGMAPKAIWFYFEVVYDTGPNPYPPYNVSAGDDVSIMYGETHSFTGYAEDDDDPVPSLNWSWTFVEPGPVTSILYGQTVEFTFDIPGETEVTLTVTDPEGSSDSDGLVATVQPPAPPATTASFSGAEGSDGWFLSAVEVTLSAMSQATVAHTFYRLNAGVWEVYEEPFTVDTEGENELAYYSVDVFGGNETVKTYQVSVDTEAPVTDCVIEGTDGAEGWYRSAVEVTLSSSDGTSGVETITYVLDSGDPTSYDAAFVVDDDGSHLLTVFSEDIAGNQEEATHFTFTIDRAPPEISVVLPSTDSMTPEARVSWECEDDALSVMELRVDGLVWEVIDVDPDAASYEYTLDVMDGVHTVEIRAADVAGNEATVSVNFTIDRAAPTIVELTPVEGASVRGNDVEVTWEVYDGFGVALTEINIDGVEWLTIDTSAEGLGSMMVELGHGEHTIKLRATDSAGNVIIDSVTFDVDSAALSFGGPYYGLPLIALIGAAVAAVAVVGNMVRSGRFGKTPPSEP